MLHMALLVSVILLDEAVGLQHYVGAVESLEVAFPATVAFPDKYRRVQDLSERS